MAADASADVSDDVSLVQSANDRYGADVADDASADVADDVSFDPTRDPTRPTRLFTRPGQRSDPTRSTGQRSNPTRSPVNRVNGQTRPGQHNPDPVHALPHASNLLVAREGA